MIQITTVGTQRLRLHPIRNGFGYLGHAHGWVGRNVVLYTFPTPLHTAQIWSRQTQQCIRVLICWMKRMRVGGGGLAESIEWFIEDQALLRSYDQAPHPPPHPSTSPISKLSLLLSLSVCRRSSLLTKGGGGGRGAKSYDREKAWPSIIH